MNTLRYLLVFLVCVSFAGCAPRIVKPTPAQLEQQRQLALRIQEASARWKSKKNREDLVFLCKSAVAAGRGLTKERTKLLLGEPLRTERGHPEVFVQQRWGYNKLEPRKKFLEDRWYYIDQGQPDGARHVFGVAFGDYHVTLGCFSHLSVKSESGEQRSLIVKISNPYTLVHTMHYRMPDGDHISNPKYRKYLEDTNKYLKNPYF